MSFVLSPDQRQLQESAHRFFCNSAPTTAFRKLRDTRDARGYSSDIWNQMVELGFSSVVISEDCAGLGLGFVVLGSILQEAGRTLGASPLLATTALGGSAVEFGGSQQQRETILGAVASSGVTLALALDEGPRHAPDNIRTTASKSADGYLLNGEKRFVIDGHTADKLVVVARHQDEPAQALSFFLVDRAANGVSISPLSMVDNRNASHIVFNQVTVSENDRLSGSQSGSWVLSRVLDRGRACLAAEMLGGIDQTFEQTMAYLKQREQFGVKIGSFQAIKHRAARLYLEIELTRSAVIAALDAIDNNAADTSLLCSLAKARANETYRLVSNEVVQMHGGIGVTDELDIGLFLKRSRVSIQMLGDIAYLRNRYAELAGY